MLTLLTFVILLLVGVLLECGFVGHVVNEVLADGVLGRELEEVFAYIDIFEAFGGVSDEGFAVVGAEKEADGWVVSGLHDFVTIVVLVGVELRAVFVSVSVDLEVDDNVTVEDAVVEDEVGLKVVVVNEDAFLTMFEAEALAEFHEEVLDLVENGGFEFGFGIDIGLGEVEELEGHGVAQDVAGLHGFGCLLDVALEGGRVLGEG